MAASLHSIGPAKPKEANLLLFVLVGTTLKPPGWPHVQNPRLVGWVKITDMNELTPAPKYMPYLTARFWEETGLDSRLYRTFVETGSYRGFTIDFMKSRFESIHSIELTEKWYNYCKKRYIDDKNVNLHHGDSRQILQEILNNIENPAIIFLDAHYSGGSTGKADEFCDTPLLGELECIKSRSENDIIIIDDISFFDQKGGIEEEIKRGEDPVWPEFAYDWTGITIDKVYSAIKPGYGFFMNNKSLYTITPREDQLICYPAKGV